MANMDSYEVNGYLIRETLKATDGGNCRWGYAERYGKTFFIKEFLSPKYPDKDSKMSERLKEQRIQKCNDWYDMHSQVYQAVIQSSGGNLVQPIDFFRSGSCFYLVTEKIDATDIHFENIYQRSAEQRHILLKILSYELSRLAEHNVVHSDIKPDNLLLKDTVDGYFTVKIIDFDASFLSTNLPPSDELTGDQVYFSPEMIDYMVTDSMGAITPKSDVFALGILFHQILCGKLPEYDTETYSCVGEAVRQEAKIKIDVQILPEYSELIQKMLVADVEKRPTALDVLQQLCWIESTLFSTRNRRKRFRDARTADSWNRPNRLG